ncbi:MAG: phenylacetate--CoA ligase family protein, partial [Actinobacteria bacterium]|nr:phenylacetate--CoA ligase family protein [Actinomycetota bacterium]
MSIRKFIKSLPKPLRQCIKYTYGLFPLKIRYGKVFWDTYNFLQKSQWWSKEKLEQYQIEELSRLINHSYKNVPYYKKVFDERGLKPKDIQSLEDLKKLPALTKDEFRKNYKDLTANNFKINDLIISHTSGTTGKPLQWYVNDLENQKELAFIFHQWSRVGVKPGEPLIQLRGSVINNKKLSEYNPITKVLRLSPIIDSKDTVKYYIEKIQKFGAKFLHGYPSAIALFAYKIKEYKIKLPFKLKAILFASENVYSWQREICEDIFGCRTYSHYGMAERVALA